MKYSIVNYICGICLVGESLFLLLPLIVSLIYGEGTWYCYLVPAVCSFLLGFPLTRRKPKANLSPREGYVCVALSWILFSLVGAVPFVMSGDIPFYVDAVFETVSGFTTTGASILSDVEVLTHSGLFWRSFSHWIGGMGVFVFMVAFLPMLGGSTMDLMKAESPGPTVDRLVPHVKDTARFLYLTYLFITAALAILLLISGLPLFDSLCMTFGSVGTGGFGITNDSCGSLTSVQQSIITVFMILSGINYSAYFLLISKKWKEAFRLDEVRWYLIIILASVGLITWNTAGIMGGVKNAFHHAFFQVASIITTTGYSTLDYEIWPQLSKTLLVCLMFIGACAGSTGGGIKVSRFLLLMKSFRKEVGILIHPRLVKVIRMDKATVKHEVMRSTNVFVSIYVVIFFLSLLVVSLDNHDFTTNFTAVAASLNNIGPGFSLVGPSCNYGFFSIPSKIVLILDMLAGRLELFPVLLLFSPSTWRKD